MTMILYGIKQCDTVRKARKWLEAENIDYQFHDFRIDGLNPVQLRAWAAEFGWQALVNKRSATWRNLPEVTRNNFDETLALAVMEDQPTLIKRPILMAENISLLGFSADRYQAALVS